MGAYSLGGGAYLYTSGSRLGGACLPKFSVPALAYWPGSNPYSLVASLGASGYSKMFGDSSAILPLELILLIYFGDSG